MPAVTSNESVDSFSAEKYRAIESIFSWHEDLLFLQSEPGYTPAMGRHFMKARRMLARRWLAELRADFDRLYRQGRFILVSSSTDRPDLVQHLWRVKRTFYQNLFYLEFCLLLGRPLGDHTRQLLTA